MDRVWIGYGKVVDGRRMGRGWVVDGVRIGSGWGRGGEARRRLRV